jgi:hypothetical protein
MSTPMDIDNNKPKRSGESSLSNVLSKRVHFGSIEESERQNRKKVTVAEVF